MQGLVSLRFREAGSPSTALELLGFGSGDVERQSLRRKRYLLRATRSGSLRRPGGGKEKEIPESYSRLPVTALYLIKQVSRHESAVPGQTPNIVAAIVSCPCIRLTVRPSFLGFGTPRGKEMRKLPLIQAEQVSEKAGIAWECGYGCQR